MRILRAGSHRQMPWKNGGGVTTEVAISPPDATVSNFDWRISMARVQDSGLFSAFADIDRVLAVLDGEMLLTIGDDRAVLMGPTYEAITFPGDKPTRAEVFRAVTDLNVMTRRGIFSAEINRVDQGDIVANADETFVLFRSKAETATGEVLAVDDVIHLSRFERLAFGSGPQDAWLIEIKVI